MAGPQPPFDPEDPLARSRGLGLDGLLALLARLDGAEEAQVAQGALAAGVSPALVVEEVRREVERRLVRTARFYDEAGW